LLLFVKDFIHTRCSPVLCLLPSTITNARTLLERRLSRCFGHGVLWRQRCLNTAKAKLSGVGAWRAGRRDNIIDLTAGRRCEEGTGRRRQHTRPITHTLSHTATTYTLLFFRVYFYSIPVCWHLLPHNTAHRWHSRYMWLHSCAALPGAPAFSRTHASIMPRSLSYHSSPVCLYSCLSLGRREEGGGGTGILDKPGS